VSGESVEHHQSGRLHCLERAVAQELHAQVSPLGVARVRKHGHLYSAARHAQLLVFHPLVERRGGVADSTQGSPRNVCEALPLQASGGKRAISIHRNEPRGSHL
jgi:hypothetical protein